MNFVVKEYDPFDDVLDRFQRHNADPAASDHTEDELIRLAVNIVRRRDQ